MELRRKRERDMCLEREKREERQQSALPRACPGERKLPTHAGLSQSKEEWPAQGKSLFSGSLRLNVSGYLNRTAKLLKPRMPTPSWDFYPGAG